MWTILVNIVLVVSIVRQCEAGCSAAYGAKPCSFLPAPPGRAPTCAKPGDTFCEQLPQYPMQHIKFLIDKWGYDYSSLFSSETRDEYSTYFAHPDYGYGTTNNLQHDSYYPESIHVPKSTPTHAPEGSKYIPPSTDGRVNYTDNFAGYPDRRPPSKEVYPGGYYNQQSNVHLKSQNHEHFRPYFPQSGYYDSQHASFQGGSNYDPNTWWRYERSKKIYHPHYRNKRSARVDDGKNKRKKYDNPKNESTPFPRPKRQSGISSSQTLCQTRSQYIMPKAAVNKEGNWMYVVNLQEVDNRLTQLVKSETCASQQCLGLCSLPLGYRSRCEQKYVQKRLVALDGAGQQLYTDVFWFPSCCICTITGG